MIFSVFMGLFFAFTRDCHWMTAYFCFIVQQTSSLSSYFHEDFSGLLIFIILFTPFPSTAIILLSFNILTYYIHIIYIKNMEKKSKTYISRIFSIMLICGLILLISHVVFSSFNALGSWIVFFSIPFFIFISVFVSL